MSAKNDINHKNDYRYLHILSAGAIVMTLISLCSTAFITMKYNDVRDENKFLKTGHALQKWQPKQEVITPNFAITLEGVNIDEKGIPDHLLLPEGFVYIAVELSVRNLTGEEQLFLPQDHAYIKDQSGLRYDVTVAPNVEKGIAGPVIVGDKSRGQIGYMVPKGQKNLTFYFEPYGSGSGATVAFDLASLL